MIPTDSLRTKLRMMLNDKDCKTFNDAEIDALLTDADCIYCAASDGWMYKAVMLENEADSPIRYQNGQESYQRDTISDLSSFAYKNAEKYKAKCTKKVSIMLNADTDVEL